MNSDLERLHPYPFEKLRVLLDGVTPNAELTPITLGIGEPQHPAPEFVLQALRDNLDLLAKYPATRGMDELRETIAHWAQRRFNLKALDPAKEVLPVTGTREALFAIAQAIVDRKPDATVISPNPFYQIYEGATLLAGARLQFLNCTADNNYLPDFDSVTSQQWQQCQLLFLCSPGNPTGAVVDQATLTRLIELAREYDFVIASDECYSEIYPNEDNPPVGLLQACAEAGNHDYRNCLVFQSLSKRSNLPGLRSGFVAGDADILERFMLYRTYQGCAMPPHHQVASIAAWSDENHVRENRAQYRQKFATVLDILGNTLPCQQPPASFYLWPRTPIDDTEFARGLYQEKNLKVLPGQYLGRDQDGINPGANHVRLALVAPVEQCREAAQRLCRYVESL